MSLNFSNKILNLKSSHWNDVCICIKETVWDLRFSAVTLPRRLAFSVHTLLFTPLLLAGERKLVTKEELLVAALSAFRMKNPRPWEPAAPLKGLTFSPHSQKTGLKRAKFVSEKFQHKAQAPQNTSLGQKPIKWDDTDCKTSKKTSHTGSKRGIRSDPKVYTSRSHILLSRLPTSCYGHNLCFGSVIRS